MKISPTIVILIAVLLSVASAVVVSLLKYDEFFREDAEIPAEFTSLEFDADDTSYSPADSLDEPAVKGTHGFEGEVAGA